MRRACDPAPPVAAIASNAVSTSAILSEARSAGSTAAAVLGQHGHRVLLLEKERFPRYRIGESLLPYCYLLLDDPPLRQAAGQVAGRDVHLARIEVRKAFGKDRRLLHPAAGGRERRGHVCKVLGLHGR